VTTLRWNFATKHVNISFFLLAYTMNFRSVLHKFGLTLLSLCFLASVGLGQRSALKQPRQEKLLNGLKVLMWSDPSADKVSVRIRVHAGSAFDPQGKEGVMKLLAENIFPTAESRQFFSEDLGGSLEIISNYDYIQINASSKTSDALTLLETLAAAVSNPTFDKETTAKLKASLMAEIDMAEKDTKYLADHAATNRLFGTFPYGRPQLGTKESVQKIDFADLRFAKDRLFGADNATIAIAGKFDPDLAYRAVRRFFGAWLKSDNKVPSTFRQPDDPDTKPLELSAAITGEPEVRFAFRGVSRSDKDFAASVILSRILQSRLQNSGTSASVSNEARILPGVVLVGFRSNTMTSLPAGLLTERVTDAEFAKARSDLASEFARKSLIDSWLDADTYKTQPSDSAQMIQNVTLPDVQRVADRLSKNPVVTVVVRPPVANAKP
jgi:predicted Zn-dependent peptidase